MKEYELRKKYRYTKLSYVYDVYLECEFRSNLTDKEYSELNTGEFRFNYSNWEIRLNISHKQMIRAIKELIENEFITQVFKGKKGTDSKYILNRFIDEKKEQKKEQNEEQKENLNKCDSINGLSEIEKQKKEQNEEQKRYYTSQYNNLNITSQYKSIEIYSSNEEELWKLYPLKRGKQKAIQSLKKILNNYSKEEIERCINRYIKDVEDQRVKFKDLQYKNGSTFFNNGYIDYLDSEYKEESLKNKSREGEKVEDEGEYEKFARENNIGFKF